MGNRISSAVSVTSKLKRRHNGSVIDMLTEGGAAGRVPRGFQLIRQGVCRVRAAAVDVTLGREDSLSARTRRNAARV